jgi:hypothetical protein
MQTHRVSASCLASLAKAFACLCVLGWMQRQVSAAEPSPLTTAQLETLMLPPTGWKMDKEVLLDHLWLIASPESDREWPRIITYPFWPAFISLETDDDRRIAQRFPGYHGTLGELLTDHLNSPDPAIKKKSELWLRQSLLLYFAGFRLSRVQKTQRSYAPWIKPEDARRLDHMADQYIAGQKIMKYGGKNPEEISDRLLAEWLSNPGACTLADVYGYFDALGATHDYLPLEFTYPINWAWLRGKGNKTFTPRTTFGHESSGAASWRLIPEELPPTTDPVCLWLRDVYLSYIAGKELFESKTLPATDKEQSLMLKEALRQWWESIEKEG